MQYLEDHDLVVCTLTNPRTLEVHAAAAPHLITRYIDPGQALHSSPTVHFCRYISRNSLRRDFRSAPRHMLLRFDFPAHELCCVMLIFLVKFHLALNFSYIYQVPIIRHFWFWIVFINLEFQVIHLHRTKA